MRRQRAKVRLRLLGASAAHGAHDEVTHPARSLVATGGFGLVFPIFVISAIVNRILYRIQLVPMRDYTYFISQFSCCCYVLIYGAILARRVHKGIVTPPMLEYARNNIKVCVGVRVGVLDSSLVCLCNHYVVSLPLPLPLSLSLCRYGSRSLVLVSVRIGKIGRRCNP